MLEGVPQPSGKAPSLFENGDLPKITASGIDPSTLAEVPWQARRAVARASTTAEAYELVERYSGEEGHVLAEVDSMGARPLARDVVEYQQELSRWRSGLD
jgi:hypothetical protein